MPQTVRLGTVDPEIDLSDWTGLGPAVLRAEGDGLVVECGTERLVFLGATGRTGSARHSRRNARKRYGFRAGRADGRDGRMTDKQTVDASAVPLWWKEISRPERGKGSTAAKAA